ncbi:unnamed protein product [Echinostoma caproni]|uniref:Uncharacterized protein n=1 Tax=Echinostoma caproni TaxID=27848 RepID=A0A183B4T3_9TREM|nr:unnamed protein product [Echinostoma caproni]
MLQQTSCSQATNADVPEPKSSAGPTGDCWNPGPSIVSSSTGPHPSTTVPPSSHWLSNQDHLRVPTSGIPQSLSILNPVGSRTMVLEPLVEPPFNADSSSSSGERTIDHPGITDSLSSATVDAQRKLTSVSFDVDLATLGGSFHEYPCSSPHESPQTEAGNAQEVAMDWESDAPTELVNKSDPRPPFPPPIVPNPVWEMKEAQERIFELWYGLPVEDWSSSCSSSASPCGASNE